MDSEVKTAFDGGSAALAAMDDEQPLRVGRYFIFRPIAEGGMGRVLLAYDETLDRKLAIKLWLPRVSCGEDLRARMLREAQALARLSHPNVVQVYEVGNHNDLLYLAMEYVRGRTLREWIEQDRPDLPRILERFMQAGEGLAAAHRAGMLHRDFKPDNVIVGDDGRVRVLDFGLARADGHEPTGPRAITELELVISGRFDDPLTRAGSVLGTPAYMSPEQLAGRDTDARSDQYSFCVALWEAIHGVRPFAGASTQELAAAIATQRPRESDRSMPGWLHSAVQRGLAAAPDARWPSMDALLATLSAGARRRRRQVGALVGLGLALLLAAGLGVVLAGRARELAACDARGAAIDEVWNDVSRADIRAALRASGLSFATHAADRTDALLNDYVATWSKSQVEVCRRVRIEHAWEPAVGERADVCIDERRLELSATVEALRNADAALVRRAIEVAASLPAVELCLDVDVLARRPPLPHDEQARAEATLLRRELGRVRALKAAGRYAEQLALATDLIPRADALGWGPLRAETRLYAGSAAAILGERDTARVIAYFEDALFLALDAGHDALAAKAALELLDLTGRVLLRLADGERWARLARSLLLRLGAEGLALTAELECRTARLDKIRMRWAAAHMGFERCHAACLTAYGPGHPMVALALVDHAGLMNLQDDYVGARDLLHRARASLEPALGPDHPALARVLCELGQSLDELGDTPGAEAALRRALAIYTQVFGPDDEHVGRPLQALGRLYMRTGRLLDAAQYLSRAATLYEGVPGFGRPTQVAIFHNLINVYRRLGDLDSALDTARRSLALYEDADAVGAEHASLVPTVISLAEIQAARGDLEASAQTIERVRRLLGERADVDVAAPLLALGDLWRARGDVAAAEQDYRRARDILEASGGEQHPELGRALARLGALGRERGRPDDIAEAIELLTRAVELLADAQARAQRGAARFELARAWSDRGEPTRARELAALAAEELGEDAERLAEVEAWLAAHPS